MGAADLLRRIDARVVPPLGAGLYRLIRGASRWPVVILLVCGGLLTAAMVWLDGGRRVDDRATAQLARVGVPAGESIPGYIQASREELAVLTAESESSDQVYALITLSAYLAPDRLSPVVRGLAVSAVYVRVPLPGTPTEIMRIDAFRVPEDVLAGMEQLAIRKFGEALDYRDLSAKLTGRGPRERWLRAAYDDGAGIAEAEGEAYRRRCSCVYAVIARGTPVELARAAARGAVRVVDPAPQVRRLDRAVFLPPLPEQADFAGASGAGGHPVAPDQAAASDSLERHDGSLHQRGAGRDRRGGAPGGDYGGGRIGDGDAEYGGKTRVDQGYGGDRSRFGHHGQQDAKTGASGE